MKKSISINEIKAKLYAAELRITQQRILIYKELFLNKKHPKAEDIYTNLKQRITGLSLATVYKTLDVFVKSGLAQKIKAMDDSVHYDADMSTHNHLICTKSNSIMDIYDKEINHCIESYLETHPIPNFNVRNIQVQFIGEKI